jgi:hypothetical protein
VIDIFTSEDLENISLCIFQYFTLYYIIYSDIEATDYMLYHEYCMIIKFQIRKKTWLNVEIVLVTVYDCTSNGKLAIIQYTNNRLYCLLHSYPNGLVFMWLFPHVSSQ